MGEDDLALAQVRAEERSAIVAMVTRWEANVPPTPHDYESLRTVPAAWEDAVNEALRLAYRRGYGRALASVRMAVENEAHHADPHAATGATRADG